MGEPLSARQKLIRAGANAAVVISGVAALLKPQEISEAQRQREKGDGAFPRSALQQPEATATLPPLPVEPPKNLPYKRYLPYVEKGNPSPPKPTPTPVNPKPEPTATLPPLPVEPTPTTPPLPPS